MTGPLLAVRDLRKEYRLRSEGLGRSNAVLVALDGVSFRVEEGETYALVGESGSGKSTLGRTVIRLEEPSGGQVLFRGRDLLAASPAELRRLRREIQILFQDPFGSLNPRLTVGRAIREVLEVHRIASGAAARERTGDLLATVGLSAADGGRYPHQFSAGQRQRISIARALAVSPRFLVADEPTSSLDVSSQAQIVSLLVRLREERSLSYLLITHNLAIVSRVAARLGVLYLGRMVEEGRVAEVLREPLHPYTAALLASVPSGDPARRRKAPPLPGEIPSALRRPPGCAFHPRCPEAGPRCRVSPPREVSPSPGRTVACHLHDGGTEHRGGPPAGAPSHRASP